MVVAIDYDETITLDPNFWDMVIVQLQARGHVCYIVTQNWRKDRPDINDYAVTVGVDVVFCGDSAKRSFLANRGIHVDVWIDNDPESIFR